MEQISNTEAQVSPQIGAELKSEQDFQAIYIKSDLFRSIYTLRQNNSSVVGFATIKKEFKAACKLIGIK